jgi:cytochrome P450
VPAEALGRDQNSASNPLVVLADPGVRENPYPLLRQMREQGPLVVENDQVVIFGDYDSCESVLRHRAMGSDPGRSPLIGEFLRAGEIPPNASIFFMDSPEHGRQRKLVSTLFTPRTIADVQPVVRAAVDVAYRKFQEQEQPDVVRDLSFPLAHGISCELFGVPPEERGFLAGMAEGVAQSTELPTIGAGVGVHQLYSMDELEAMGKAVFASHMYFADLAHRRRRTPADDLVSQLAVAAGESGGFSRFELSFGLLTVFSASYESTANLISNTILALLRNPGELARLRADPGLVPAAVDEVLRHDAPAQLVSRVPLAPTRIGEVDVHPGQAVVVLLAAANRDPSVYQDPDRFDIGRTQPKPSLSFGLGAHFCVGVSLAKLTVQLVLEAFLERYREIELVEESISYRRRTVVRGLERMNIRFV